MFKNLSRIVFYLQLLEWCDWWEMLDATSDTYWEEALLALSDCNVSWTDGAFPIMDEAFEVLWERKYKGYFQQ